MTEDQKKWLNCAIILKHRLNGDSFKCFLTNEEEARRAWTWFKSEGSVRDANFNVNEYIRSRLEEYFKIDDPSGYRKLTEIASKPQNPPTTKP